MSVFPISDEKKGVLDSLAGKIINSRNHNYRREIRCRGHTIVDEGRGRVLVNVSWLCDDVVVKFAKPVVRLPYLASGEAQNKVECVVWENTTSLNNVLLPVVDYDDSNIPLWVIVPVVDTNREVSDSELDAVRERLDEAGVYLRDLYVERHIKYWNGCARVIDYGYLGHDWETVHSQFSSDVISKQMITELQKTVEKRVNGCVLPRKIIYTNCRPY